MQPFVFMHVWAINDSLIDWNRDILKCVCAALNGIRTVFLCVPENNCNMSIVPSPCFSTASQEVLDTYDGTNNKLKYITFINRCFCPRRLTIGEFKLYRNES